MGYEIRAEMDSQVLKILVSRGDAVHEGQTLAIVESMKMEMPVMAETSGTVTDVKVSEGDVVKAEDVMVVID